MSFSIGNIIINDPVILAPMSGVTDKPFRRLVKRCGAGLVVSEMIASKAMVRAAKKTMKMSSGCYEEHPMSVQLAGCDPEIVAEAAKLNQDRGAAIIDINMGCPVKKVVNDDAGSALMRDEVLAGRILKTVVKAVDIPVTLNNISFSDEYEGDFTTRRALIYTLTFSAKTQLFGAIADSPDGIIKKVMVDIYQDTNTRTARKSVRYTTTPKAKKDYDNDGAITAADDPLVEAGDDFGFNETTSIYLTPTKYSPSEGKDVDG